MSYVANETSRSSGQPVEVFEIIAGSASFFYTSDIAAVPLGAVTYSPVRGIQRSKQVDGQDKRKGSFTVEMPTSDPFAQLFLGNLPGFRVRLKVKRFHRADLPNPEVVVVFDGYVLASELAKNGLTTRFRCRDVLGGIGGQIPRRVYSSGCNHILYDEDTCRADDTNPAFRAAALSVGSQVSESLTVPGLAAYGDGWFNGGFVEAIGSSDFRLVLDHVGDTLTLLLPFASSPSTVNVFAGCGHSIAVCKEKFDNVLNFGGFAFVPGRNPFQVGIL